MILLAELGLLGLERDVLLAEQLDEQRGVAVEDFVAMLVELRAERVGKEELREVELAGLQLGFNLLDEVQVRRLRLRAIRVAGHRDVALAALLIERGEDLALVKNPPLKLSTRLALRRARVEPVKERGDLAPVAEVNLGGHKAARGVDGEVREGQQIHWRGGWETRLIRQWKSARLSFHFASDVIIELARRTGSTSFRAT